MSHKHIPLIRRFKPAKLIEGDWEGTKWYVSGTDQHWHEITKEFRALIIAEPGAGKTYEARHQAQKFVQSGKYGFFIRIENLKTDFAHSFEVGDEPAFQKWLTSSKEAWFFLDSVDEAQLHQPSALENALKLFGQQIHPALERAHIFITSREDAWETLDYPQILDSQIPHSSIKTSQQNEQTEDSKALPAIFQMEGLNKNEQELYAAHCGIGDDAKFVQAIAQSNLGELARRPFDMEALAKVWNADQKLGGRLEVLSRMVELQIAPVSTVPSLKKINVQKRHEGICELAAAVVMMSRMKIAIEGGSVDTQTIDPTKILPDWSQDEIAELLETGVFDDVLFGTVRFRHREIRELFCAYFFLNKMNHPQKRKEVENLFFREVYGEQIIVPRLRPALSWLILLDPEICKQALQIEPNIAIEGGDPKQLDLDIQEKIISALVSQAEDETP